MTTITLSSKGQLVIPKRVRDDAKVVAGSQLDVRYLDGEIRLRPIAHPAVSALDEVAGCLARSGRKRLGSQEARAAIKTRLKAQNAA